MATGKCSLKLFSLKTLANCSGYLVAANPSQLRERQDTTSCVYVHPKERCPGMLLVGGVDVPQKV